jgi:hypothetical protein
MVIQKTEIYETERLFVRHKPDGNWNVYLKTERDNGIAGELTVSGEQFEELAEIIRSMG